MQTHNILAVDYQAQWRHEIGQQLSRFSVPHIVVDTLPLAEVEIGSGLYTAVFAGDMQGAWGAITEPAEAFALPLVYLIRDATHYHHALNERGDHRVLRIPTWKKVGRVVGDALDLLSAKSAS